MTYPLGHRCRHCDKLTQPRDRVDDCCRECHNTVRRYRGMTEAERLQLAVAMTRRANCLQDAIDRPNARKRRKTPLTHAETWNRIKADPERHDRIKRNRTRWAQAKRERLRLAQDDD